MSRPRLDLAGQRYGRLVAQRPASVGYWSCRCDCGAVADVQIASLRRGHTKSCGCAQHRSLDLTGLRFTRLVAVEPARRGPRRQTRWRCVCDCGATHIANTDDLRRGNTRSCGCLFAEVASATTRARNDRNRNACQEAA